MISKLIALVVILGACHAAEHAYSSQSIVRYDDHSHNHEVKVAVPVLNKVIPVTKIAIPIVKAVPVVHYVSESSGSSGLGHYGSESSGLSSYHGGNYETQSRHGHESHHNSQSSGSSGHNVVAESSGHGHGKHAVSSQHIHREDVPAHPPKDFYEYHGHPKYEFEYKVQDHHTGDNKYQHESRDGDLVKGVYSLHEADGSIRTVEYGSDKHTGFTASIKQTTKHIEEPKHSKHHY